MKVSDKVETKQYPPEQFFKNVFENMPAPTAVLSGIDQLVALNTAFKNFFQLPDDESQPPLLVEDISSSFWKKQDLQEHLHYLINNKEEQAGQTFDWQHEDGSLRYVELKAQWLPSLPNHIILTFCDVSAVKQTEKEHNDKIRHMMHELRNPLSNISLCVELLADSTKENNQEDTEMFLSKASNSVQRMKQVINDLNAARRTS